MTVESAAAEVISKVGLWWPTAEEEQIRRASAACERASSALLSCAAAGTTAAAQAGGDGQYGAALDALAARWARYDGDCVGSLASNARAASILATALLDFAAEVEAAKNKIRNLAIELGVGLLVSAALAPFTFGASAIAGSVRTAMFIGRGLMVAAGYSQAIATIVTTGLALATFGAVEGFATSVIAQALQWGFTDGSGINLGTAALWGLGGAVAGPVIGGAVASVGAGVRGVRGLRSGPTRSPATPPGSAVTAGVAADGAGLLSTAAVRTMARDSRALFDQWDELPTTQIRANKLLALANVQLRQAALPELRSVKLTSDSQGEFLGYKWRLGLNEADLAGRKGLDDLLPVLYHEMRHAEQDFLVARLKAGEGMSPADIATHMKIPRDVAETAALRPIAPLSPEGRLAAELYDSVHGGGRSARKQVITDLFEAHKRHRLATEPGEPTAEAFAAWKRARAAYDDLPAERDAILAQVGIQQELKAQTPALR